MISLLETCKVCDQGVLQPSGNVCPECNGRGKVFIGFGDDSATEVTFLMLDYLIRDYTTNNTIDRMAHELMIELADYEADELAYQAELRAEG